MPKRNWRRFRPNSLREAIEGCIAFALERHNRSVDQVADLMGLASKWTLYKWMQTAKLPAIQIRAFEHATGAAFVTQYLGASAHKLVLDMPSGKRPSDKELLDVNQACVEACQQLFKFYAGERPAEDVLAALTVALEDLAYQRANVERAAQPEFDFSDADS